MTPPNNWRLILRDQTSFPIHARRIATNSCPVTPKIAPYDGFSTEGMTYNSHFFIRIATFEMTCVALPLLV